MTAPQTTRVPPSPHSAARRQRSASMQRMLPELIERSRYIVLFAVVAVLLTSMALFLLASGLALVSIWDATRDVLRGELGSKDLTVAFLNVVSTMLKAVIFYLIGTGMYSLFIGRLPFTAALGVRSLADLETRIISVVIVIMAVVFLERFTELRDPLGTLQFGGALGVVTLALVVFVHFLQATETEDEDPDDGPVRDPSRSDAA